MYCFVEFLFTSIHRLDLQTTASGIRDDFKSAVTKYQQYQQEKSVTVKPMPISTPQSYSNRSETVRGKPEVKPESEKFERPIRFPAEDIRYKNAAPPSTIVSLPVVSQAPLVSNVYQDEDDDENSDQQSASPVVQSLPPVDIGIPLLSVGEDFQALVSIVVNPSYFFVQNTAYTQDLEKLAQSMK